MNNLEKNIKMALENDLFYQDESSNENSTENKIFDIYGNYYFPTDFYNTEENSLLSILLEKVPTMIIKENNKTRKGEIK